MTMYRNVASEKVPQRLTRKGCRTKDRTDRSELVCSTCFMRTTCSFFRTCVQQTGKRIQFSWSRSQAELVQSSVGQRTHLDGIETHVVLTPNEVDPTETTCTQCPLKVEVIEGIPATELPATRCEGLLLLLQESSLSSVLRSCGCRSGHWRRCCCHLRWLRGRRRGSDGSQARLGLLALHDDG